MVQNESHDGKSELFCFGETKKREKLKWSWDGRL